MHTARACPPVPQDTLCPLESLGQEQQHLRMERNPPGASQQPTLESSAWLETPTHIPITQRREVTLPR